MQRVRRGLSYSNVMATLAVFIALGGGAYALTRGEVKSRHIAPDAVKAKHIAFGVRSIPMMATFTGLGQGTGAANYAPMGSSGVPLSGGAGLFNEALAPQTFIATGLRINLDGPVYNGTRDFILMYYDTAHRVTDLRCQVADGARSCASNARARIPAGATVWFREEYSGTTEVDYAEVGWRAVLP